MVFERRPLEEIRSKGLGNVIRERLEEIRGRGVIPSLRTKVEEIVEKIRERGESTRSVLTRETPSMSSETKKEEIVRVKRKRGL